MQPDTLIPGVDSPQSWNRFSYVNNNPIRFNDPTGHDLWDSINQFAAGFVKEVIRSNAWFAPPQVQAELGPHSTDSTAMMVGRIAGDIVSTAIGIAEVVSGAGVAGGGTVIGCGTTLCVASPVAIAAGAALAAQGAMTTIASGSHLGENLVMLAKRDPNKNKIIGDAFRDEVAQGFKDKGYGVEKEVVKKTPFGNRRIDIEVTSPDGDLLGGVETKWGGSRYTASQRAKDAWLKLKGYVVTLVRNK